MPYPDEIVDQLSQAHQLPPELSIQLRECLQISSLAISVNEEGLNPNLLITETEEQGIYIPSYKILSKLSGFESLLNDAQNIVKQNPNLVKLVVDIKRIDKLRISDPYERTERKILLRELSDRIYADYDKIKMSRLLTAEIIYGSRALALQIDSEVRWLQKEASQYFHNQFLVKNLPITAIEYLDKVEGVQLGNRMLITYSNDEAISHRMMMYIKTHQHGSLREQGSTLKSVDLKELYFYKVLEYTGYGPKAHFFYNVISPSAFYIATQDEGFSADKSKMKFFSTYGSIRERLDAQQEISTETKMGIFRTDILLRIFNLWDIIMNSGNFGYVTSHPSKEKWRIIDFRVGTSYEYRQERVFEKYRDAEGMEDYTTLPKKVMFDAGAEERITFGNLVINEFHQGQPRQSREGRKTSLIEAMNTALLYVQNYSNEHNHLLQLDLETVYSDLNNYHASILDDLSQFSQGLAQHNTIAPRSPRAT
ncbi:MAG: hypothetical protein KBD43_11605 [Saprospiraceae bacterium]|nr:hypothetical protein [Saprospiraceae bacterium]